MVTCLYFSVASKSLGYQDTYGRKGLEYPKRNGINNIVAFYATSGVAQWYCNKLILYTK